MSARGEIISKMGGDSRCHDGATKNTTITKTTKEDHANSRLLVVFFVVLVTFEVFVIPA
jgi:hypothetical protein